MKILSEHEIQYGSDLTEHSFTIDQKNISKFVTDSPPNSS